MEVHGQGTTEYLVIIAVVVVISLIVVGLMVGLLDQGGKVSDSQSKIYWSSQPLAITDSLIDSNGNILLTIRNNTGDSLALQSLTVNGTTVYPDSLSFTGQETKTVFVNKPQTGATTTNQVSFTYLASNGLVKTQSGSTKLNSTQTSSTIIPSARVVLLNQNNCFDWNSSLTYHPICTCNDLNTIDYNSTTRGWDYSLSNNLDFKNCDSTYRTGGGWKPIGTEVNTFNGKFLGNNHTIKNLYVYRPDTNFVGLFGYMSSSNYDVNDLGMIDSNITGFYYVGGISGQYGKINNSYNTGTINGKGWYTGGINGSSGTVNNSYNIGTINGIGYYTGGIIGVGGIVNNSYNTGTIIGASYTGGIKGGWGTVNNSYNTGTINGTGQNTGGIIGGYGTITNSYNTGNLKGTSNIGGILGIQTLGYGYYVANSFSTGSVTGSSSTYGTIGSLAGSIALNIYWYDSNVSDNATTCYQTGDANCTKLTDTNFTLLYNPTTDLYDTNTPVWDSSWVWSGSAYPRLSWQ